MPEPYSIIECCSETPRALNPQPLGRKAWRSLHPRMDASLDSRALLEIDVRSFKSSRSLAGSVAAAEMHFFETGSTAYSRGLS